MVEKGSLSARTNIQILRKRVFFVWETEIEHNKFVKCECGKLCKKVKGSGKGPLLMNKFVALIRETSITLVA